MIDEVAKYNGSYVEVNSFENIIDTIRNSGSWLDSGNGIFTRDFGDNDDFRLTTSSPMINTGTTVPTRAADILGNELVGNPDIGPYEFQAPVTPTSLSQYKSDGTSLIPAGGWINETSVVLKFNMSSTNSPDSLTPYVEVQPNTSSFTDSMTHSGTEVQYSDSPVLGSVTVTGLVDGMTYHWQASTNNVAGTGSWTAKGSNPDFGVDTSAPTGGSITYADGYNISGIVPLTVDDGIDSYSGIDASSRTFQRRSAALSNGTCDAYGDYSDIVVVGTYPDLTDNTVSSGFCYQYQYLVSDNAGNQATYTGSNTVKVDSTVPTGGSITYADGYNTLGTVSLTVADGTDSYSGINASSRTFQRRSAVLSNGTCDAYGDYSDIVVSGDYPDLTDNTVSSGFCYQYQYLVSDNAGNQATYTVSNTVKVDTSLPSAPGIPLTTTPTTELSQTWVWTEATNMASGVVRYIWRVTGTASLTGTTTSTSVVTNLGEGTYTFFVKAESGAGLYSAESQGVLVVKKEEEDVNREEEEINKEKEEATPISSTTQPTLPSRKTSSALPTQDCTYELEAPTLYSAVAQSSSSILLYLSDKSSTESKYILEYGTESGNYTKELVGVQFVLSSSKTYLVESLSPNTTYYFRIRRDNKCTKEAWSNEVTATTEDSDSAKKLETTPTTKDSDSIKKLETTHTEEPIQNKTSSSLAKYIVIGGVGVFIMLLIILLAKKGRRDQSYS